MPEAVISTYLRPGGSFRAFSQGAYQLRISSIGEMTILENDGMIALKGVIAVDLPAEDLCC